MTLDKTVKYAGRFGDKDTNSPTGSYKNKSDSSTNDGSFLEQDWANDAYDGLSGAFLANVHDASTGQPTGYAEPTFPVEINGNVDNAQSSQVYNAWYKKTQDVVDAKIAELITLSEGCFFNWYSGGLTSSEKITPASTDYELIDFKANAGSDSPIYLGNNINIDSTDSTILNFSKAGTYFLKPVFYPDVSQVPTMKLKLQISKPSDNGAYVNYFDALDISKFIMVNFAKTSGSALTTAIRKESMHITTDPALVDGNNFNTLYFYASIATPSLFVVIDEDNAKVKMDFKAVKSGSTPCPYNASIEMQRISGATLSSPYMTPTDFIVTP